MEHGNKKIEDLITQESPFIISIGGPRQSGKTTLIKSLVYHYTKESKFTGSNIVSILNPTGELSILLENINDTLSSITCLKISDLIISTIDGFFGIELISKNYVNG